MQYDGKSTSTGRKVFRVDFASGVKENLFYQGKAEAVALFFMRTVGLIKFIE